MMRTVAMVAAFIASPSSPSGHASDVEARWRREYPQAAARWEVRSHSVFLKGKEILHTFSGDESTVDKLTVACRDGYRLVRREGRKYVSKNPNRRPVVDDIWCYTPAVHFELARATPTSPYIITTFNDRTNEEDPSFDVIFLPAIRSATEFTGLPLVEMMNSAAFITKSVESLLQDGMEIVRINYRWDGKNAVQSGFIDLEPRRDWAIRGVDFELVDKNGGLPARVTSTVQYRDHPGGVSFPSQVDRDCRLPDPATYEHQRILLEDVQFEQVPAEIFGLPHYGLPDFPLRPVATNRAFSLGNPLLWGSFATAILSFALLWFMRRKSVKPTI